MAQALGSTLMDHTPILDALMPLVLNEISCKGAHFTSRGYLTWLLGDQAASSRKSAIDVVATVLSKNCTASEL